MNRARSISRLAAFWPRLKLGEPTTAKAANRATRLEERRAGMSPPRTEMPSYRSGSSAVLGVSRGVSNGVAEGGRGPVALRPRLLPGLPLSAVLQTEIPSRSLRVKQSDGLGLAADYVVTRLGGAASEHGTGAAVAPQSPLDLRDAPWCHPLLSREGPRAPGRLEPDIHCKPGGVQTRTHANAMVVEGSRARPVGPNERAYDATEQKPRRPAEDDPSRNRAGSGLGSSTAVKAQFRSRPNRTADEGTAKQTDASACPEMAPGTLSTREASNRGRGNDKRRIARLRADVRPLSDAQAWREEQWQDDGREEARHEKPPCTRVLIESLVQFASKAPAIASTGRRAQHRTRFQSGPCVVDRPDGELHDRIGELRLKRPLRPCAVDLKSCRRRRDLTEALPCWRSRMSREVLVPRHGPVAYTVDGEPILHV